MAAFYLDTSALAKRYVGETGSAWMVALTDRSVGHHLYTLRVTGPEMISALSRKFRTGEATNEEVRLAIGNFRVDWYRQYEIVEVSSATADRAMLLAERHGLRGYDALHLAAALESNALRTGLAVSALTLLSADVELLRAAGSEGLPTDNPNLHP